MVGIFSYIADITKESDRTVRIGIISLTYSVGVPFGMAFSGILLRFVKFCARKSCSLSQTKTRSMHFFHIQLQIHLECAHFAGEWDFTVYSQWLVHCISLLYCMAFMFWKKCHRSQSPTNKLPLRDRCWPISLIRLIWKKHSWLHSNTARGIDAAKYWYSW